MKTIFFLLLSAAVLTGAAVAGKASSVLTEAAAAGKDSGKERAAAARLTLKRAATFMRSISTEGGYVYKYSPDLQKRTAERPTTVTQIAIQPPGTPTMGMAFLRAYAATRDPFYLESARAAAMALKRCQLGSGGWHATADFDPTKPNVDGAVYGDTRKWVYGQFIKHALSTKFDDNTTQSAVNFLLAFTVAARNSDNADNKAIRQALDRALTAGMLGSQYPNGAWPQCYHGKPRDPKGYPVKKAHIPKDYPRTWPGLASDYDYTAYYTLNDNALSDCIKVMFLAWKVLGKLEYLESAKRGADFLLLAQLPEPQPAWAQQYNFNMEPAWARYHESPSVCSCESGSAIQALLDTYLETGDGKYFNAVESAVAWLRRSMIGQNKWARLYELGTNRPVYGDKRGKMLFSLKELANPGSTWESRYKLPETIARYEQVKSEGLQRARARAGISPENSKKAGLSVDEMVASLDDNVRWIGLQGARGNSPEDLKTLESSADAIVASMGADGRWISMAWWRKGNKPEPVISTATFIKNVRILTDYLHRADPPPSSAVSTPDK